MTESTSLVRNERSKLTAVLLNNLAASVFVTAIVVPLAATTYGTAVPKSPYWWIFGACWVALGAGIHGWARWSLGGLKE
ncbi:MAG TPA: hypothetical protein VKI44_35040 [Acetobacteraceae bacterium]|nr:hypothetical protein [Acetobacteraceae bacterium]